MSRPYSEKFLLTLQHADEKQVGVILGRLCVDANLPASYIAAALETTRMTVYSWFRGQDTRRKKRRAMELLIEIIKKDFEAGILPARTRFDAKLYMENIIGGPLDLKLNKPKLKSQEVEL